MAKKQTIIGLDELEAGNNDLFIRKSCTDLDKHAVIIVEETHQAIFIKDGEMVDTLQSGKYPVFDKKDKNVSRVDVIFMSKTAKLKAFWGTINKLILKDVQTNLTIEVGANGEYEVQIKDPRKFYLELVGADKNFNLDKLKERLQGRILSEIEPLIAQTMREENLAYYDLSEKKQIIAKNIMPTIQAMFEKDYGLNLYSFIISKIFIPQEYIDKIENELEKRKQEEKMEKTAKEYAQELERLSDKEFERSLLLKKLEDGNYDKYLEVCKILGWEPKTIEVKHTKGDSSKAKAGTFCTECGNAISSADKFCPGCGKKVEKKIEKNVCPKCEHVNAPTSKFCNNCGAKLG